MTRGSLVAVGVLFLAGPARAGSNGDPAVDEFLRSVSGKALFLKIDVLRVHRVIGGQDATNVDRDGQVYYRAHVAGFRSSQTTDPAQFADEVREQARQDKQSGVNVRSWGRGSAVQIEKAETDKHEVELDLKLTKGESKIRFRFDDKQPWDLADVKRLFHVAFAESEAELSGAANAVTLDAGMTTAAVIAAKGNPRTRVNLGTKTVLTYDDMKITFQDDKLVDVQ